jgi:ADP-dependent phosphofructokinase/glucokinase
MSVTTIASWQDRYAGVADRLTQRAPSALTVLTGTSACVDAVFKIDAQRMARLETAASTEPTTPEDTIGAGLITRVLERVRNGRGGELLTRWPAGSGWITELLGGADHQQLGGTGPQASWALATLGAPSVLALADRSREQLSVVDPRTGICAGGLVVPAGEVTPVGQPTKFPHCILEFSASIRSTEAIVPRSTRIILRFGDEPIEQDEQFAALTPALVPGIRAGLLSGLNGLPDDAGNEAGWLREVARSWSAAGLDVIHHELAEFPSPERLRRALTTIPATSVGLSLSELFTLTGRRGDPRFLAKDVALRAGAARVIVHADDWSLNVSRDSSGNQTSVLLAGNTLAAARARTGQPSRELTPPSDAAYTDDLPGIGPIGDGWFAVAVPTPYLGRPAATVGLGDTFVAGLLLAESLT